jgi:phage terminase large subunit
VFHDRSPEVVTDGPAGTGKSRGVLEKLYLVAEKYPGMRGLMVRKTRASLTQTALVTWERHVLPAGTNVKFHSVNQEYRFPNGSVVAIGGLDKDIKIMSAEYDMIVGLEVTEFLESDWEAMTTRLRNGVVPYQQIVGDCNPSFPNHWIKQRNRRGSLAMHKSEHSDNPVLWDAAAGEWTTRGAVYISKLDALTGVRKARLRHGQWIQAEGAIYTDYDSTIHLIDRFEIPVDWPRLWVVDFGFTDPFVWQNWAIGPDRTMHLDQEIYMTGRIVEDHAKKILEFTQGQRRPMDLICDHDAEDRRTLERHLGMSTTKAYKAIGRGIQNVQSRLRVKENKRAGIYIFRDCLQELDRELADRKVPTSTIEEIEAYIWDPKKPDAPAAKQPDHGLDCIRYGAAEIDDLKDVAGPADVADFNVMDL